MGEGPGMRVRPCRILCEQPDGELLKPLSRWERLGEGARRLLVFGVGVGHGYSTMDALELTALVGRAANTSDSSVRLTSAARREEKSESSRESGSRLR